eukprot:CAMPEP_0180328022 /NCGR_PEP_ID=MMETSP0988-20121125/39909_1 /TAXON_ID=697907 /ORGANISM="non described non described, Strain CCMP2293" /LENGTH=174 /DNA_ID=CAMNT_0022314837 /DNA_START=66 /DNA_END=587 /DNA_ORIENTATION=+
MTVPIYPAMHEQSVTTLLPVLEVLEKKGHAMQTLEVAPVAPEYFPASHNVHAPAPLLALKVPGSHATHASTTNVFPAAHEQSDDAVLPAFEKLLSPQVVHSTDPIVPLYVPSPHWLQGPPSAPVYPKSHPHTLAPGSDVWSCPHVWQVFTLVAPEASPENFPASQRVHAIGPVA